MYNNFEKRFECGIMPCLFRLYLIYIYRQIWNIEKGEKGLGEKPVSRYVLQRKQRWWGVVSLKE
jgi:hypothetical protein